jgi:hypothetical protein
MDWLLVAPTDDPRILCRGEAAVDSPGGSDSEHGCIVIVSWHPCRFLPALCWFPSGQAGVGRQVTSGE